MEKYTQDDVHKWLTEYNGLLNTLIKYLENFTKENKNLPQYDIDFCENYSAIVVHMHEDVTTALKMKDVDINNYHTSYPRRCDMLRSLITEIGSRSYYCQNLIEVLDPKKSTYGLMTGVVSIFNLANDIEVKHFL